MQDIHTRLRNKIDEGHPRIAELEAAAKEINDTYMTYRGYMLYGGLAPVSSLAAFDEHLTAVRRAHELLEELDAADNHHAR